MTRSKERPTMPNRPTKPNRPNPITRSSGGKGGPTEAPREISPEERDGVSSTDTDARSALGVGESFGRRGENAAKREGKEPGRREAGTTGKAKRPADEATGRDASAINPHGDET